VNLKNGALQDISEKSAGIRQEAFRLGFTDIGFSKARFASECEAPLSEWLGKNYHAGMEYMNRNYEKRLDPTLLVDGAKTVISLLFNYFSADNLSGSPFKIAKYAYGQDYHEVIKSKLAELSNYIKAHFGEQSQRCFVDSAPVMERFWAQTSGLGWIGKSSCLISRKHGSFFFIAEIITSLELEYDEPINDYCGSCRKCIEACPTKAITENRTVNSHSCISYQTIENRSEIPSSLAGRFSNYIFGCDICQDVCPWNKKSHQHSEPLFSLKKEIKEMTQEGWRNLDEEMYRLIFRKSAVKRTKFSGLQRNIRFVDVNKSE
jgi:epoxyqueuosine reductase